MNKKYVLSCALLICILALSGIVYLSFSWTGNLEDQPRGFEAEKLYSYLISTNGTYYVAYNRSGFEEFGSTDFSTVTNWAIGNLTNGGLLYFPNGTYVVESPIKFGTKVVRLVGEVGLWKDEIVYENYITCFKAGASLTGYMIEIVGDTTHSKGSQVKDILLYGNDRTTPKGAIAISQQYGVTIERVAIYRFVGTNAVGIHMNNTWLNTIRECHFYTGGKANIEFGDYANSNWIYGGCCRKAGGVTTQYGLWFNAEHYTDTNVIIGMNCENFDGSSMIGIYLQSNAKYNRILAGRCENDYGGIKVDSGNNFNLFFNVIFSQVGSYTYNDAGTSNHWVECINADTPEWL